MLTEGTSSLLHCELARCAEEQKPPQMQKMASKGS